jgi:GNAT superfamily N-acetyltransferase
MEDSGGQVIVAESGGRVVALGRVRYQAQNQAWLEGMRVDPHWRGRGIASRIHEGCVDQACRHGARVVRLGTASHNRAVLRLAERSAMQPVGTYALWTAESLAAGPQPELLGRRHTHQVHTLLAGSEVLARCGGLYSAEWVWEELSPARVSGLLGHGHLVASADSDRKLNALATVHPDPDDGVLWLGFADATPTVDSRKRSAALRDLGMAIRVLGSAMGMSSVEYMVPDIAWLRGAIRTAGFGPSDREIELLVFERKLAECAESRSRDEA